MQRDNLIPARGRPGFPIRMALLGSVSLLPMAAVFFSPRPAYADCPTVISSSVTGPVFTSSNCDLSVTGSGMISGGSTGVFNYVPIGTLSNAGTITASFFGVNNAGSIATLSDTGGGLVSTGDRGINNQSSAIIGALLIGTLSSTGSISAEIVHGAYTGVDNNGSTIFQLSNGGTIQGGTYGIVNMPGAPPIDEAYPEHAILNATPSIVQASINTLTNTGSIVGGTTGIYNNGGFIGTLTNFGTIAGTIHNGINNAGTIGTINNAASGAVAGIIAGGTNGIYNAAVIGTLSNSGTITATDAAHSGPGGQAVTGVQNFGSGVITLLSNAAGGVISGGSSGIYNLGSITTLSNAGSISGGSSGIDNEGAITTLTNTGKISGGSSGIDNEGGSISQLTNSGTITGTTGAGIYNNVNRGNANALGTITTLANQTGGLISGVTGVFNADSIGTLTNTGSITGTAYGVLNNGSIGGVANNAGGYISFLDNTSIVGGGKTAFANAGGIATITNSGTIAGATYGINNTIAGSIGTLTNSGAIIATATSTNAGGFVLAGLSNQGSITSVINQQTGTIAGAYYGFDNEYDGTLGTLINAGLISGADSFAYGLTANNTIGVIDNTNTGTITGGEGGISVDGIIGTIINAGTIAGQFGIYASGDSTIGTLANSGLISSTHFPGLDLESGTINSFTNTGKISSDSSAAVNDSGVIGTVTNNGTIVGKVGFINDQTVGALLNETAGTLVGLITGSIGMFNSAFNENGDDLTTAYIGTITNGLPGGAVTADTIFGSITGLANSSTIAALSNNGTIAGGKFGITNTPAPVVSDGHYILNGQPTDRLNQGSIATLTNTGSITGGSTGIYNDAGYIGTLTNSGSITGTLVDGIQNTGTILTIVNLGGTIIGGATGLFNNNGIIGTIINTGGISGNSGIDNAGYAGTLANSGTVIGRNYDAIYNSSAGTIASIANTGLASGNDQGVLNYGTITLFSNGPGLATVFGGSTGVRNDNLITLLTNSGTIAGNDYGVVNGDINKCDEARIADVCFETTSGPTGATIATLANAGTIYGGTAGVYNDAGYIGTLTNGGTVTSHTTGIDNSGDIGTLTNSGTIYGGYAGIYNDADGTIGSLDNMFSIAGSSAGAVNDGTIGQLTNSGTITGAGSGLDSQGSIGTLINTGLLYGGTGAGLDFASGQATNAAGGVMEGGAAGIIIGGQDETPNVSRAITNVIINPSGTALVFNNAGGLIEGAEGAVFQGAGSTLINAGTIISTIGGNAVDFGTEGPNYLTITTGSDIIGTIYGGDTDGQIALDGTGTLNNTITDFAPNSALNVAPGANWTAYGNWQINTVTNDGVFQPGIIGTPLNLTGNFVQNPDGTLRVLVNPSDSPFVTTHFNITGTAQLAGGVAYYFAPGTYSAGTIAFLSAAGGVTGGFTSVTYNNPPAVYTHSTLIFSSDGDLRLAIPAAIVAPLDDSIFSDEIQSSAATAQTGNTALLNKASEGEAASAEAATCAAEAAVTPADVTPGQVSGTEKLTNAVASAICGAGGWIQATGTAMRAYGDSDVPSYDADTAGFLAGIDKPVNTYGLRLGLAVGYDETFLLNGAGSKGQVDTTRFGIFGSQPIGQFTLAGDFMFGLSNTTTQRVTGVGYANSTHAGDVFSGALQIETLEQEKYFDLIPQAGIRIAAVNAGGFDETGSNIVEPFSLIGAHSGYDSVQPFVTLSLSHRYLTGTGVSITPEASLGYFYEAGSRGRAVTLDARDGTVFTSHYVTLAGSAGQGEFSLAASKGLWSWYARYSADVAGNWVSQTGEAGLRLRF